MVGHPLTLSLNVHPQSGIDHCDQRYPQAAKLLGWDTSKNATIPCDMSNASFASALFNVYYDASPLKGAAWWWTDYDGCGGPNPLGWSNHVYASHRQLARGLRPMLLSRWGGLGSHRYPVGFSGDTFQHELQLDFEIQTTPTAANVLHAWSHDIGGFHPGKNGTAPGTINPQNWTASELYLRWIQFGALSPILRTHVCKCPKYGFDDYCERRIWEFPHFLPMRDAFYLRAALVPYLYTEALTSALTGSGVQPVHPVFYDHGAGAFPEAYSYTHQYKFGGSVLVAPISTMVDNSTGTVSKGVWLPPGAWARWDGSDVVAGPAVDSQLYTVEQIPLFVPAGTILALAVNDTLRVQAPSPDLVWTIWPGSGSGPLGGPSSGNVTVIEDDGASMAYVAATAHTSASYELIADGALTLTVAPTVGTYAGMPRVRTHFLQLRVPPSAQVVAVTVNGVTAPQVPAGTSTAPGWYRAPGPSSLIQPSGAVVVNAGSWSMTSANTVVVQLK